MFFPCTPWATGTPTSDAPEEHRRRPAAQAADNVDAPTLPHRRLAHVSVQNRNDRTKTLDEGALNAGSLQCRSSAELLGHHAGP